MENYPIAYDSYCREITLPVWYGLTDEMIDQVIDVVIQSVEEVIEHKENQDETLFSNGLCLPSGSSLTENDLERVVEIFHDLN